MRTMVLRNGTGYRPEETQWTSYLQAIGYLSQWGSDSNSYAYVEISIHSDGDIAAAYHPSHEAAKKANRPAFFLMGICSPSDGSYSFHS